MDSITVNGFTWHGPTTHSDGCEVWRLDADQREALGTSWCLKNYGTVNYPGSPFCGWRLVSGGPFGEEHDNLLDCARAASGVMRERALRTTREIEKRLEALRSLLEASA